MAWAWAVNSAESRIISLPITAQARSALERHDFIVTIQLRSELAILRDFSMLRQKLSQNI